MIIRMTAGTFALLGFAASIFAGLWAGNDADVILTRAWWALILCLVLGGLLGWMAQTVVMDHLQESVPPRPARPAGTHDAGEKPIAPGEAKT